MFDSSHTSQAKSTGATRGSSGTYRMDNRDQRSAVQRKTGANHDSPAEKHTQVREYTQDRTTAPVPVLQRSIAQKGIVQGYFLTQVEGGVFLLAQQKQKKDGEGSTFLKN